MKTSLPIDGKVFPFRVSNAADYFLLHDNLSQEEFENILDNNYELYQKVSQIIGLKQSCFLLWNTTRSCQSIHDSLLDLKNQLIKELLYKYGYVFDETWFNEGGK